MMSDDISDIAAHYDSNPQAEADRLRHQQLEHEMTWQYLDRYLPTSGSVLELGAATGAYTLEMARRGLRVTAVDISQVLVDEARHNIEAEGLESLVTLHVADARDLSGLTGEEYDAVLIMGPLYHLIEEIDRRTVLNQAYTRMRTGAIVFSAFLSRFGVLSDLIKRSPAWIEGQAHVRSMLDHGKRPADAARGGFRAYFARVPEIAPLHEDIGFETILVAGLEPVIGADDESFNRLVGRQRELWLDALMEVSVEESIVAASRHLLYVGMK